MVNLQAVSSKTQTEEGKFYEWLQKMGNIYLADIERMDRAFNIVTSNAEKPVNKGLRKL